MTVSTTNISVDRTGDGATVDFSYDFKTQAVSELVVYVNDVLKTYTTHYTATRNANGVGGTVTFLVAPAAAAVILIGRTVALTQATALPVQGNIPERTMENMFDKLTLAVQQVWGRALRMPANTAAAVSLDLPAPEANKALAWNDDADALENVDAGTVYSADASVAASASSILSFSGGPITGTGTLILAAACALGDTIYASATNVLSKLSGNTSATRKYLGQTGTGAVSAAPTWTTIDAGDIATGALAIARGGTNNSSLDVGATRLPFFDGTKMDSLSLTSSQSIRLNGAGTAFEAFTPGAGSVGTVTNVDQTLTGLSFITVSGNPISTSGTLALAASVTAGDTLYASATDTISKLAKGTGLQYYRMNAGATAPEWVDSAGYAPPGGRLTLTTAVPVTSSDVTAAGTIYYTPHKSRITWLQYSSVWYPINLAEISLALTATSGSVYDVFIYATSATAAALETLVWTNTTTRATGISIDTATGFMTKTGDVTRIYLGTFYATGTNQTEDSFARRMLWNYHNRVQRSLFANATTATWTYASTTIRAANANTTPGIGRCDFVIGVQEVALYARYDSYFYCAASAGSGPCGIALDSTTAVDNSLLITSGGANFGAYSGGNTTKIPAVGYHYVQALESALGGATITFNGSSLYSQIHGAIQS